MQWKKGSMPNGWGGIVLKSFAPGSGFFFADFCGDHVLCNENKYTADQYNNSLELPPKIIE